MTPIVLTVPILTKSGDNAREHWSKKQRRVRQERVAVAWAWVAKLPFRAPNLLPCTVTIVRHSAGRLDEPDGITSALKATRDEVAYRLGLPTRKPPKNNPNALPVADDTDERVTWAYRQETCPQGKGFVTIEIAGRAA